MHVPRYGIPQTTSWPRAIAKAHLQATETCGQTFPCLSHTRPSRSFPHLPTSSCPGLSWVCQSFTRPRHVSVMAVRFLGVVNTIYPFRRRARLQGITASVAKQKGKFKSVKSIAFSDAFLPTGRPCYTNKRLFHACTSTCAAAGMGAHTGLLNKLLEIREVVLARLDTQPNLLAHPVAPIGRQDSATRIYL